MKHRRGTSCLREQSIAGAPQDVKVTCPVQEYVVAHELFHVLSHMLPGWYDLRPLCNLWIARGRMRLTRTGKRIFSRHRLGRRAIACAVFAAGLAAGCTVHSAGESVEPTVRGGKAFSISVEGVDLEHRWWQALGDERLTGLVELALSDNLNLQQARLRMEQSAALERQAAARLFPTLDAEASADRTLPNSGEANSDRVAAGLQLSWEIDLWQRLKSFRKATELETAASYEDLQATALLLSAEVAQTYFGLIEQRLQLELLTSQVEVSRTLLGLIELRFAQGQASVVDVYQQRQQLASTQAQFPPIRSRLRVQANRLNVLVARSPAKRPPPASADLPTLPAPPKLGVPSSLLVNRPDLRRIRYQLAAADYLVAEAVADRLPWLQIGIEAGYEGSDMGRLTPDGLFTSLMSSVAGPVFDWGRRKAEVHRRKAIVKGHVLALSQAYLTAIEEVESALWRERRQRELIEALDRELAIARRNLQETQRRYGQGLTDFLPVLIAIQSTQALERNVLTQQRELVLIRILLYRALGGAQPWVSADGKGKAANRPEGENPP